MMKIKYVLLGVAGFLSVLNFAHAATCEMVLIKQDRLHSTDPTARAAEVKQSIDLAMSKFPLSDIVVLPEYTFLRKYNYSAWLKLVPTTQGTYEVDAEASTVGYPEACQVLQNLAIDHGVTIIAGTFPLKLDIDQARFPDLNRETLVNSGLLMINPQGIIQGIDLKRDEGEDEYYSPFGEMTTDIYYAPTHDGYAVSYYPYICYEFAGTALYRLINFAEADLAIWSADFWDPNPESVMIYEAGDDIEGITTDTQRSVIESITKKLRLNRSIISSDGYWVSCDTSPGGRGVCGISQQGVDDYYIQDEFTWAAITYEPEMRWAAKVPYAAWQDVGVWSYAGNPAINPMIMNAFSANRTSAVDNDYEVESLKLGTGVNQLHPYRMTLEISQRNKLAIKHGLVIGSRGTLAVEYTGGKEPVITSRNAILKNPILKISAPNIVPVLGEKIVLIETAKWLMGRFKDLPLEEVDGIEWELSYTPTQVVATVVAVPETSGAWVDVINENFDSGWGAFIDGGRFAKIYTNEKHKIEGSGTALIRANYDEASSFYLETPLKVISEGYEEIMVEFMYQYRGMEEGDSFVVEGFDGVDWTVVQTYIFGAPFENHEVYSGKISLDGTIVPFTDLLNIRFRCTSDEKRDFIYIDNMKISAFQR